MQKVSKHQPSQNVRVSSPEQWQRVELAKLEEKRLAAINQGCASDETATSAASNSSPQDR